MAFNTNTRLDPIDDDPAAGLSIGVRLMLGVRLTLFGDSHRAAIPLRVSLIATVQGNIVDAFCVRVTGSCSKGMSVYFDDRHKLFGCTVRNNSLAINNSPNLRGRMSTGMPRSDANATTVDRVIPLANIIRYEMLFVTIKTFSPLPSATRCLSFSRMAS